jgi:hypothetical protein
LICLFDVFAGLYNPDPIIDQDWGLHFHHLKSLEAFWKQGKSSWGYNPLFMAGYPSNTIQDLSIKLFEFLALALSLIALTPIQWFKISAFIAMAAVPWLMYFSARNLFAREETRNTAAVLAALLGTIYWWNSLPREMFFYGMIGYSTAAYASILGVSLFYRLTQQQTSWGAVHLGWIFFAIVILALHVQSLIIFLPCIVALLIARRRCLQNDCRAAAAIREYRSTDIDQGLSRAEEFLVISPVVLGKRPSITAADSRNKRHGYSAALPRQKRGYFALCRADQSVPNHLC